MKLFKPMKSNLKPLAGFAVAAALVFTVVPSAFAAQQTTNTVLTLTAQVENQCQVVATQSAMINLGVTPEYDVGQGIQFSYICNPGTQLSVEADGGLNTGADARYPTERAMVDGQGHALAYSVFQDQNWTTPLTTGSGALSLTAVNANGVGDLAYFGLKVFDADRNPQGTYTDTLTFNVTYQ